MFYSFADRIKKNCISRWVLGKRCTHICLCVGNSWLVPFRSLKVSIQFPHAGTELLCLWCYDSASRCRYEPPLSDGNKMLEWQAQFCKSLFFFFGLTFPESGLSHVSICCLRDSGSLVPAADCTAAASYLSSKNNRLHFALCLLSSRDTRTSVCSHLRLSRHLIAPL